MPNEKQITLILGLHRSGTSMLAAGLKALGLDLGQFDDVQHEDNPKGYFEHPEVRDFNDRVLATIGASWDNWAFYAPHEDFNGLTDLRHEAQHLLRTCFSGSTHVVLKDPRILTLLPFWNRVFEELAWTVNRVLIVRDPREVAASQLQRTVRRPSTAPVIADSESMCAMWAISMHSVLLSLPDNRNFLLDHSDLLMQPASTMRNCAAFLELAPDEAAISDFATAFVDERYYRSKPTATEEAGPWERMAVRFYASIIAEQLPRPLDQIRAAELATQQLPIEAQLPYLGPSRTSISRVLRWSKDNLSSSHNKTLIQLRYAIWHLSNAAMRNVNPEVLTALKGALDSPPHGDLQELTVDFARARLNEALNDDFQAEQISSMLMEKYPSSPLAFSLMLKILRKRGDSLKAENLRERAAAKFPENPSFHPQPTQRP